MKIYIIAVIFLLTSCKSYKNTSKKELSNIHKIDSISNYQIEDRIIDFKEEYNYD